MSALLDRLRIANPRRLGRKPNPRRAAYVAKYGLTGQDIHRRVTERLMDQLDQCKDDAARRLLLGVSRKKAA